MKKPPKPGDTIEIRRINLAVPLAWANKVDDWRRRQPDLPNMSEAIRRLVEMSLESKGGKHGGR